MPQADASPTGRSELLTIMQVCELLQCARITLERLRARGLFPKPIHLSGRLIRWRRQDIEAFLRQKATA